MDEITRKTFVRGSACDDGDDECGLYPDPDGEFMDVYDHLSVMQAKDEQIRDLKAITTKCCFCGKQCASLEGLREHSKTCEDHPVAKCREELGQQHEARLVAEDILADIVHLWIDQYIAKNSASRADESISQHTFERAQSILHKAGVIVGYGGWERLQSHGILGAEKKDCICGHSWNDHIETVPAAREDMMPCIRCACRLYSKKGSKG